MEEAEISVSNLHSKIKNSLISQGFKFNPQLKIEFESKEAFRKIHKIKRNEQIIRHKKFLINNFNLIEKYYKSFGNLNPEKIDLELIEIKSKSVYSKIFFWWNLIWWSIPYTRPIGRQMRFIIWDKGHNLPFGLIGLQSPTLSSKVRDDYLGLNREDKDYWINQSLYAQRIGALPPYNDLLGGKMVSLSLTANKIRNVYAEKYKDILTIKRKRIIPNRLMFITTTSAFGKSSMYDRIKYNGEIVAKFLGYTSGAGTFHISEMLYKECLRFLNKNGFNIERGMQIGPSRKLKLIAQALRKLNLPNFEFHQLKRGFYLFLNVENLFEVIHNGEEPIWYERKFSDLVKFWMQRWCLPRSKRINKWREFNSRAFLDDTFQYIKNIT